MKGMSEFIKEHEERLKTSSFNEGFLAFHLHQVRFLQHERLVHLIVLLFVMFAFLLFLVLFLFLHSIHFLALFLVCLLLTIFYVFHYFKLENTVIKWYFIFNDKARVKH